MLRWFRKLTGRTKREASADAIEQAARAELQRLRQDELSVGAHMRKGLPVKVAPVQTANSPADQRAGNRTTKTTQPTDEKGATENFSSSLAMGVATGSVAFGYAIGGSAAGASAGASLTPSAALETERELP